MEPSGFSDLYPWQAGLKLIQLPFVESATLLYGRVWVVRCLGVHPGLTFLSSFPPSSSAVPAAALAPYSSEAAPLLAQERG